MIRLGIEDRSDQKEEKAVDDDDDATSHSSIRSDVSGVRINILAKGHFFSSKRVTGVRIVWTAYSPDDGYEVSLFIPFCTRGLLMMTVDVDDDDVSDEKW